MAKIYMVIAEEHGYVNYGIDEGAWLCGIYFTEEEAKKRCEHLQPIADELKRMWEEIDYDEWIATHDGETDKSPYDVFHERAEKELGFDISCTGMADDWEVEFSYEEYETGDVKDTLLFGASYME